MATGAANTSLSKSCPLICQQKCRWEVRQSNSTLPSMGPTGAMRGCSAPACAPESPCPPHQRAAIRSDAAGVHMSRRDTHHPLLSNTPHCPRQELIGLAPTLPQPTLPHAEAQAPASGSPPRKHLALRCTQAHQGSGSAGHHGLSSLGNTNARVLIVLA